MVISVIANLINLAGNCLGVFVVHAGVAGVTWPSLISRVFSAVMITWLCFGTNHEVFYTLPAVLRVDGDMQKSILRIAVPNGVEAGSFSW